MDGEREEAGTGVSVPEHITHKNGRRVRAWSPTPRPARVRLAVLRSCFSWPLVPPLSVVIIPLLSTVSKKPTSYCPCLTLEKSHYLPLQRAHKPPDTPFPLSPWVLAVCHSLLGTGGTH